MEGLDYWQRLKELRLYSIERRFERYFVIYVWKILNGLVVNPGIEVNENYCTRSGLNVKVPKFTLQLREHSFMVKGPTLFNSLPKELKEFPNLHLNDPRAAVTAFKKKLDNHLKIFPDEPNLSQEYSKRMTGINLLGDKTNSIIRIRNNQFN